MNLLLFMFVLLPTFRQFPALETCTGNPKLEITDSGGITDDIKNFIVDKHNKIREKVASGEYQGADGNLPTASNMQVISWDEELANSAQAHADYCKFAHFDPAYPNEYALTSVLPWGQNIDEILSQVSTDKMDWTSAMADWEKESKDLNSYIVSGYYEEYSDRAVGHFTQMIWANTSKIGCGYTKGSSTDTTFNIKDLKYTGYYTCNYLAAGNVDKKPIYDTGDPCSKCPQSACDSIYPHLCSSSE